MSDTLSDPITLGFTVIKGIETTSGPGKMNRIVFSSSLIAVPAPLAGMSSERESSKTVRVWAVVMSNPDLDTDRPSPLGHAMSTYTVFRHTGAAYT